MDVGEFFDPYPESRAIFDRVLSAVETLGEAELRVTKSQVALVCEKPFAWAWIPKMYLRGNPAPLVLSFSFPEPRPWPRWKEIYRAGNHRFTHHLELRAPEDVDEAVAGWLREARDLAQRKMD
jgi:hypothetical protein